MQYASSDPKLTFRKSIMCEFNDDNFNIHNCSLRRFCVHPSVSIDTRQLICQIPAIIIENCNEL